MFQFRRFPTYAYLIQRRLTEYCSAGFPHSDISGSTVICTSPKLFAACHVLHRLLMPRHSPCALYSLTSQIFNRLQLKICCFIGRQFSRIMQAHKEKFFWLNCIYPLSYKSNFLYCCLLIICIIVTVFSFQGASLSFNAQWNPLLKTSFNIKTRKLIQRGKPKLKVFFAYFLFQKKVGGGPKWTRTTDLTIISRVL